MGAFALPLDNGSGLASDITAGMDPFNSQNWDPTTVPGFSGESLGIPTISTSGTSTNWASLVTSLANTGVKAWQTDLAANIAQSQINNGQLPTFNVNQLTGAIPAQLTSGVSSLFSNPITLWIIVILFFVLLFRHSGK